MIISQQELPGTLKDEQQPAPSTDERLADLLRVSFGTSEGYRTTEGEDTLLSNSHNGPTLEMAANGNYAKLKIPGLPGQLERAKRGRITGFTDGSRRRMSDKFQQCDRSKLARFKYFCTLTWPYKFPRNRMEWRAAFRRFTKALRQRYDIQAIVWKLEPQKRLAPHYHLLIFSHDEIDPVEVAQLWHRSARTNDPRHLAWHLGQLGNGNEPCITRLRSWNGVIHYCSKYCSKSIDSDTLPTWWHGGRFWGIEGELPIKIETVELSPREAFDMKRMMRKYFKSKVKRAFKSSGLQGIKLYCSSDVIQKMMTHAAEREQDRLDVGGGFEPDLSHYRNKAARGLKLRHATPGEVTEADKLRFEKEYRDRLDYYGREEITPEHLKRLDDEFDPRALALDLVNETGAYSDWR